MHRLTRAVILLLIVLFPFPVLAQVIHASNYDIGTPDLEELWVDPINGNDDNSGSSRSEAFRTINEAWQRIPNGTALTQGYEINLTQGTYPEDSIPNYWEERLGTFAHPVIFRSVDGPLLARLGGDINMYHSSYIYFIDLAIVPDPAGDAFHCELCDHILIRGALLDGGNQEAHETIKVNQSTHFYIENSEIQGADDNAIDFVAVQYGHIKNSRIHNANDWCAYVKGGSSYILFEGNHVYDCGTGGFTAGQGAGFEFMSSPFLYHEAMYIKAVNNIIHDTQGAGLGVNGGYNILFAHNTLYRVGRRSHLLEVVFGERTCDGNPTRCGNLQGMGGWGPASVGPIEPIPNENVFLLNNLVFNPADYPANDQHFAIYGPRTPSGGTNIPSPAETDIGLHIEGNLIANGDTSHALGIEGGGDGCQAGNASCNETQIRNDNSINALVPELRDPENDDFRPQASSNIFSVTSVSLPDFDASTAPAGIPTGDLQNMITQDRGGSTRSGAQPPGAYSSSESSLVTEPAENGGGGGNGGGLTAGTFRCAPRRVTLSEKTLCTLQGTSSSEDISSVTFTVGGVSKSARFRRNRYSARFSGRALGLGRHDASALVTDAANNQATATSRPVRVRRAD